MLGGLSRKQYYWELRQFTQSHSDKFRETIAPVKQFIYIFKRNNPDVIVRTQEPVEKVHSWSFTQFQVLQRLNDNPKVFHWKHIYLPFRGQLSMALLDNFNKTLKEQIEQAIPRRTKALQKWINSSIDEVFLVSTKSKESVDQQNTVLEVKTLVLGRYKNYFETKSWKGRSWEALLDIADRESLNINNSFGLLFEESSSSISNLPPNLDHQLEEKINLYTKKKKSFDLVQDLYQSNPETRFTSKFSPKMNETR